ncbi:hypothetical protein [Shewanella atlantica]|uniref:hypothetical protein n=1 Tax=Shewanella atlantica TaxID=271099 RepID=UPI00373620C5
MSKIFKLKKYLTIEEAIRHLSESLEEPVSLADLYRLVLDKHLTMSARLINQAYVKSGQYINSQDGASTAPVFDEPVQAVDGIWDLAMIGREAQEIEELYQKEVGGIEPDFTGLDGFFLRKGELFYKLQRSLPLDNSEESQNIVLARLASLLKPKGLTINDIEEGSYALECLNDAELEEFMGLSSMLMHCELEENEESAICLPLEEISYQFVIRTNELTRFVQSLQDEPPAVLQEDKPLAAKERNTLLVLIGALCKALKIDPTGRGVCTALTRITELAGTTLSGEVIRKILLQIPSAMERKRK